MDSQKPKGITITELIRVLQSIKKENGELEVWLAGDEEGNTFSPFVYEDMTTGIEDGKLVLYPCHQFLAEEVFNG